jgi:hypothetical protein
VQLKGRGSSIFGQEGGRKALLLRLLGGLFVILETALAILHRSRTPSRTGSGLLSSSSTFNPKGSSLLRIVFLIPVLAKVLRFGAPPPPDGPPVAVSLVPCCTTHATYYYTTTTSHATEDSTVQFMDGVK